MAGDRYVALGLATARSTWFTNVARWATVGSIPLEFVKCMHVEELRARLASGRPFSAVLIDAATGDVDRDLLDLATAHGASVVVVDDARTGRDWATLGARAVLEPGFDRQQLLDVLRQVSTMIGGATALVIDDPLAPGEASRGRFIAVTGRGGAGVSTVAMALAQGIADDDLYADQLLLADLRLDADLAMLHDARDVVPGVQELAEAHRSGRPTGDEIRRLTFEVVNRRYRLLLGLRRHRDWAVLRPRALDEALAGLQRTFRFVVADIDPDLEGQDATGSAEVEERNLLARSAVARADVVVVVGHPGVKGLHALARVVDELHGHGLDSRRILAVVNRAGRSPRSRAEISHALAALTSGRGDDRPLSGPIFLPDRRGLDDVHRDGARLPNVLTAPLVGAVRAVLDRTRPRSGMTGHEAAAVAPGSIGSWFDEEAG
jgi:MinD-like ATPase involved in chromosome partitioning or flagellar assembly